MIHLLQQSKELRSAFKNFGRAGVSERAIQLAKELVADPSYFNAIKIIGKMHALQIMARDNGYWAEKSALGYEDEYYWLLNHKAVKGKNAEGELVDVTFEKLKEGGE